MAIGITNTDNMKQIVDLLYPVGSIYMNAKSETLPAAALSAVGTLERLPAGNTVISAKVSGTASSGFVNDYTIGETGGEETHTLTLDEMPKHSHQMYRWAIYDGGDKIAGTGKNASGGSNYPMGGTTMTGGSGSHNNTPLYSAVAMWKRTA